jgi:hypothetical protein
MSQPDLGDIAAPLVARDPLSIDEIPLPRGYDRSILEPSMKLLQRAEHEAKVHDRLEARALIMRKASKDKAYQRKVLELCRRDPVFWCEHFLWTYDDRVQTDEPFVLYPFQIEKMVAPFLEMIKTTGRERWTECHEKSRGVGYTWVELFLVLWLFSFYENWSTLIGSVHEKEVDDGGQEATHESLFGKLRYMMNHLPRWMRDELYGPWIRQDKFNKANTLKNPLRPKNIIKGKQFGSMFGRSQRFSWVWGDEIAHAPEMKNADTSLKQTTNRASFGSTPNGKHTLHYQFMRGNLKVHRYTLHWSEHPELDVDWYNTQRQHMTDEQIAQELDIDYESSAGNRVLPEVKVSTHFFEHEDKLPNARLEDGRMVYDGTLYDPSLPLHVIIDPGISDNMAAIWTQSDQYNGEHRIVDFVQTQDRAIDWIVPLITGQVPETTYRGDGWKHVYNPAEQEIIRRHGRWEAPEEIFGDAYGSTRSMATGGSAYDELEKYGLMLCPIKILDELQSISHLQLLMRHVKVSMHLEVQRNGPEHTTPTFSEVLSQWRYKKSEEGHSAVRKKPVHDRYCHGGDCLKIWGFTIDLPDAQVMQAAAGRVHRAAGHSVSVSKPYRPRR